MKMQRVIEWLPKLTTAGIAFVAILFAALPLQAGIILSQDLNTNTNGISLVAGGGTADRTGTESTITAVVGGKSIVLNNTSATGNPTATASFAVDNTNQSLKISFDYFSSVAAGTSENPSFQLRNAANSPGIQLVMKNAVAGADQGKFGYHNGTAFQYFNVVLATNDWYNIEVIASAQSAAVKTFDLKVTKSDNTVVIDQTGLSFRNQLANYSSVQWFYNAAVSGTTGRMQLDNIEISSIPEPATISMLGIGAFCVMLMRRSLSSRS
ncbi:MAG: PEP-CTERM sorting domain-containing protein [Kiritimatiellaceae bacterium]|nr:PEP-CTERM sorting domain-containing protein [Kiritimatiellaceae bacterium]